MLSCVHAPHTVKGHRQRIVALMAAAINGAALRSGGLVVEAQKGEWIRILPGDSIFEVGDFGVSLYRDFLLPKGE